jgi:hypothetical protein
MARSYGRDWRLDDAERLSREHPHSFFIPSLERRSSLRPDDWVRLVFLVEAADGAGLHAERMWLTDIRSTDGGRYVGVLTNSPDVIRDLAQGDEIEFGPEHVIATLEPDAIPDSLRAFANRRLIRDDDLVPRFIYHDPSQLDFEPHDDGSRPSGWVLMVGDETEDELHDRANIVAPSLGWLAERYPAFGVLVLSSPGGREYHWDDETSSYVDTGPYVDAD